MALARETKHQAQTKLSVYFRDIRETKKKLALSLTLSLNLQFTEELGAVEVGGGGAYRIPTDEVGNRQVIATLVEVAPQRQPI